MGDADAAVQSYEQALRINQWSIPAMQSISCILRTKEQFPHAVDYLKTILTVDKMNGEVWGNLGMAVETPSRINTSLYTALTVESLRVSS